MKCQKNNERRSNMEEITKETILIKLNKRIKELRRITNIKPTLIFVSQEEKDILGDINTIDGVELMVQNQKGRIKTDCFAYDPRPADKSRRCKALTDLYCEKENCRFYKNRRYK